MLSQAKERDYLFDNYKALLVFLVVVGHFIEPCYKNNEFLYFLKWLIVSFHMPAFIFISGYFSKKEIPISKMIQKLLVPYLVYEVIYYLLYVYIIDKPTGLYLFYPKFSLWYILALFFWRVVTPFVKKIPHHMILSIIGGLLIGCSGMADNFLSIPRVLVFYPFFLAGIHFDRKKLEAYRTKKGKMLATIGVVMFALYLAFDAGHTNHSPKIFYGRYNYEFLNQGILEGVLVRLFCYAAGFGMTFALLLLISEKRTKLSYIGSRTMAVYLFHGLTYSLIKGTSDVLASVNTAMETLLLLCTCFAVMMIFSKKQFTAFTNKISSVSWGNVHDTIIKLLGSCQVTERDLVYGK